ncbi:hypothetical protein N0V93_005582 [Gnomoniopsis smithogilvyi]|uniref:PLC-like phosphodiesterase n=1 Tax=Gnomoniopsis smithogilvyi TaxID=1191159 RepID=A0A9W8YWV3_9PEZI|nr:hypothetical protein N0V93_005582 [Gnomoniopsis smithogilvyi]
MLQWALFVTFVALARHAAAQICNGHAELCDRKYSNITFIGSHDSAFVGSSVADNQETSVADQLAQGVRFLQAQTHLDNNTIKLCHTLCALEDAGPLADYLSTVKTFLDNNPNEVVTLLLTNPDGQSGTAFDAIFQNSGIKNYAFTPPSNLTIDGWPTLGQMISSGQRFVVFMDFPAAPTEPYILNEFQSYIFTTDPNFAQCAIDRPSGASAAGRMILVNHFLDTNLSGILIPNRDAANVTNSASSITAQANLCTSLYQRNPNFILLDWISIGDAMATEAKMNGVTFTPTATPTASSTGGTSSNPTSSSAATGTGVSTSTGAQSTTPESVSGLEVVGQSKSSSQLAAMIALLVLVL